MKRHYLLAVSAVILAACGSDNNGAGEPVDSGAVIGTRTAGYDAGAHSVLNLDLPIVASNELDGSSSSDVTVVGGAGHFYRLLKFGTNTISRYSVDDPATPIYTYSTESADEDSQSNPYSIIEVSDTKAYVLRYGSGKMWIVNPSAASEAAFKIGEIDLSHYDADGVPEMATALLDGDLLYVGMQRLEFFSATRSSYVAVIDTTTDEEVDTRVAGSDQTLLGIDLGVRNVTGLSRNPDNGEVLAIAVGGYDENFAPVYDGGIVAIDSLDYTVELILDDGDQSAAPYGQFQGLTVAGGGRAYFTASTGFGSTSVYAIDPQSGELGYEGAPVAALADLNLGDIALDSRGRLWVAQLDASAPGVTILDSDDTILVERVDTVLIPTNIDFIQ